MPMRKKKKIVPKEENKEYIYIPFKKEQAEAFVYDAGNSQTIPMYKVKIQSGNYKGYTFLIRQEYCKESKYDETYFYFGTSKNAEFPLRKNIKVNDEWTCNQTSLIADQLKAELQRK